MSRVGYTGLKYNTVSVGETYESNNYGQFKVIRKLDSYDMEVKFINTGYTCIKSVDCIKRGRIRDPFYPIVYGVGYHGEGNYKTYEGGNRTPACAAWKEMIRRCYGGTHKNLVKNYRNRGVTVCREWHNFQNFAAWFEDNHVEGYHLDKDILNRGCYEYSPDNCCYVPPIINLMVSTKNSKTKRNGVSVNSAGNYVVRIHRRGVGVKNLGTYQTEDLAFSVYKKAKEHYIQQVATEEYTKGAINLRVYNALMEWEILPYG